MQLLNDGPLRATTELEALRWRQLTLPLRFPEPHCMATLHGHKNQRLIQLAAAFSQSAGPGIFFIKGGRGEGKSHCLKAICAESLELGLSCAYLPLRSYASKGSEDLEGLENYDVLALDDLQAIKGRPLWENALFHLMNRIIYATQCKIFITANQLPTTLNLKLPDLTSRLSWGHVHTLHPLTKEERIEALRHRAKGRGLELDGRVIRFLLNRIEGHQGAAFEALERLDFDSLRSQRRLTIPFVKSMLGL